MLKRPKVLLLHDKSGCGFWRSWQPMKEMQRQGLADIRYLEVKMMNTNDLTEHAKWCDIMVIRGLMDKDGLSTLKQYQALGIKVVTDYDDLHFNVSPWNPAYKNFGTEEIRVKDPKSGDILNLWIDGQNGFDIKRNMHRFHSYKAILQAANLITTPTVYLKDAMTEIAEGQCNIEVLPNALDLKNWKPLDIDIRSKYKDTFRFGWSVSNSHGEDWLFIKDAILQFLAKHKDAKFVVIGDASMNLREVLPTEQIEWYPFSDLWEYHYSMRMPMLGLDCAIAPLAETEFNKCKSPLKFAEYTAFGWPVIAQNMTPYKEHIINGETGLLASTTEEWINMLDAMYYNKNRSNYRFNAMFTVREMFDLEKVAKDWARIYTELLYGEVKV